MAASILRGPGSGSTRSTKYLFPQDHTFVPRRVPHRLQILLLDKQPETSSAVKRTKKVGTVADEQHCRRASQVNSQWRLSHFFRRTYCTSQYQARDDSFAASKHAAWPGKLTPKLNRHIVIFSLIGADNLLFEYESKQFNLDNTLGRPARQYRMSSGR